MNPLERMQNGIVRQFRPKYPRGTYGVAENLVRDYDLIVSPADPRFGKEADEPDGSFPCMIQVFGHQASDQADGNVVQDMWSFWCYNRDVRQGDLFLLYMNPEEVPEDDRSKYDFALPFFVRAEDYTNYPNTGNITTFVRVFGIGVAPPEGYGADAGLTVTQ